MAIKPIEIPEPTYTEYQGWDKWEDKFKPIKNHLGSDPDQQMFETYGEEVEFVTKADNKYVWTWIQGDMEELYTNLLPHPINHLDQKPTHLNHHRQYSRQKRKIQAGYSDRLD
jgi:hypothetical protein